MADFILRFHLTLAVVIHPLKVAFTTSSLRAFIPWAKVSHSNTPQAHPHNLLGTKNSLSIFLAALRTTVHTHLSSKYVRGHSGLASLGIFIKLVRSDKVNRQNNLHTIYVVEHLQEERSHSTTNNHLIDFVQHIIDQLDLIYNFSSSQDGQEGLLCVLQALSKIVPSLSKIQQPSMAD